MTNQMILTPQFLDEALNGLLLLAEPEWLINQPLLPEGARQERMIALYRPLRDQVANAVTRGQRPVSIAGDCCTSLGVLAGLQKVGLKPTLIWLDAHGDFNTWETTPSGFLGGMPLAMLVGRGEQTLAKGLGLVNQPEDRVILSDARDLDPGERIALANSGLHHYPDPTTLLTTPLPEGPLYVHFDTDILSLDDAPAMNYPVPDGPSANMIGQIFRRLAATERISAVSVSSWNPELPGADHAAEIVMKLVRLLIT